MVFENAKLTKLIYLSLVTKIIFLKQYQYLFEHFTHNFYQDETI